MPVVEVDHLVKRYGRRTVVDGASLRVEEGEIFGILGPNGAGKTTTAECIAGLRRPDGGTIRVHGLDPQHDATALHRILGVQLQDSQFPDRLRVDEALELYSSFYQQPADWRELMSRLGLAEQCRTAFRRLSGGQRQRLSIALALIGNPRVAILDELTTGLDPAARRETWQLIEDARSRGVTILLVTHFMEEAERLCDRVAVIDLGKVVALDTPDGLAKRVDAPQHLRFIPSAPIDENALRALPGVTEVACHGETVSVVGTDAMVGSVTGWLASQGIVARSLRVDQATLYDAFVALVSDPKERS
ncbi:MAG: ABC transporter ATP-binding protein [Jatrophihabitans sp.]